MGTSRTSSESWAGICFERSAGPPSHAPHVLTSQPTSDDDFVISPSLESEFGSIMATSSDDLAAYLDDCFDDSDPMSGDLASQVLDEWSVLVDDSTLQQQQQEEQTNALFFNSLPSVQHEALFHPEPLELFEPKATEEEQLPPLQPQRTSLFSIPIPSIDDMPSPSMHYAPPPPAAAASADEKRCYRQNVAIPRYLGKRQRRKWGREIMHKSRSEAAFKRPRKTGKFHRTAPVFVPVAQLTA